MPALCESFSGVESAANAEFAACKRLGMVGEGRLKDGMFDVVTGGSKASGVVVRYLFPVLW